MSLHPRDMLEISELASAAADGRLAERDAARLGEILKSSTEAREYYVRFMSVSAGLAWAAHEQTPAAAHAPRRNPRWWLALSAAAALLLVAFGFGYSLMRAPPVPDPMPAVLVDEFDTEWADARAPQGTGLYRLNRGLARLQFNKGANVWLEGPAEFDVRSPSEGFLRSGKVLVNVPSEAHGFRIGTPQVLVTDRGTGFGLDVRHDSTAVHVFKGEVDVTIKGTANPLLEGNAVIVNAAGTPVSTKLDLGIFDRPGFIQHDMTGPDWAPPWFGRGNRGRHEGGGGREPRDAFRGGPHEFVRQHLEVAPERWYEFIAPRLAEITRLQADLEFRSGSLGYAAMELNRTAYDPGASDAQIAAALKNYRSACNLTRQALETAESDLRGGLSFREECVLTAFGYLH
jgi:hypothetical protein